MREGVQIYKWLNSVIFIDSGLTVLNSEHRIAPLLTGLKSDFGACYLLLSAGYSRNLQLPI